MKNSIVIYAGQPRLIEENLQSILYTLKKFKAKAFFAFWENDDPKKIFSNFLKEKIPDAQIYYINPRDELTSWISGKDTLINKEIHKYISQYDALQQSYELLKSNNELNSETLLIRSRTDLYLKPSKKDLILSQNSIIVPGIKFGVGIYDIFAYGKNNLMKNYFSCINSMIHLYKNGYLLPPELVLGLHLGQNKVPFIINRFLKLKLLQITKDNSLKSRTSYHAQICMRPSIHLGQWHDKQNSKEVKESFFDEIINRLVGIYNDLKEIIVQKSFP